MITIIGLGYVGLSSTLLFADDHIVYGIDTDKKRIALLQQQKSPLKEALIEETLCSLGTQENLIFTSELPQTARDSKFVLFCLPTDYDEATNQFNTQALSESLRHYDQLIQEKAVFIIKSTIPLGYCDELAIGLNHSLVFVPEFLREGQSLHDNYYPSRVVIGDTQSVGDQVQALYKGVVKNTPQFQLMNNKEAEAVKLFANNYLAMRVAFFNELDSFCENANLSAKAVIDALSLDDRIGSHYNNPSFGYGGYCLPKDTKELSSLFLKKGIQAPLIQSLSHSNQARLAFIADQLTPHQTIGIFKLAMKKDSDNYRESASYKLYLMLKKRNKTVYIFDKNYQGPDAVTNFTDFVSQSAIIVSNRLEDQLIPYQEKVYSRDIYNEN